jgi:predicted PurR-regulated permease PerM
LKFFDKKTAQALLTILVFALVLMFLYVAWRALITFLFAIFFAYILEAPVSKLQTWLRGSRPAAIAVVYLLFAGLMILTLSLLGPPVMDEATKLVQQAPELEKKLSSGDLLKQLGARHGWNGAIMEGINHYLDNHRGELIGATQNFVVRAAKNLQSMWWLFLVPILAIFFLKDGHQLSQNIINSVEDTRNRRMLAETVQEMDSMLGHFIRAQLTLAGLAMLVVTFVLWIMRVPYAFALGPAAGALEFIPVVGPAVGGLMVLGVALLSGYNHFWWLFIFLLVWRCVQDYVTSPRIMGESLELHPLAVLFGVFAGGEVAGVIGVFLSIPVLATLRILWHTWLLYRRTGQKQTI